MKTMKTFMAAIFAGIIISTACPVFCGEPVISMQIDNEIMPDTRNAIRDINNILFESMKSNKPAVMMEMFVDEGKADKALEENVKAAYDKMGELAKGTGFDMLHEYLVDVKGSGAVTVTLPGADGENFLMNVDAGKGPLYMSFLISKSNFKDLALCFVYMKKGDAWRLHTFHLGTYRVGGKTPVQWYSEAREMYENGWDVPAMQRMQLIDTFMRPAPFLQYEKEPQMRDFFAAGAAETSRKYKFPVKATWVKDMPAIYGLDIQFTNGKLIPVVIYVTQHPLNRAVPIQDEADAITQKIEKIIPGITRGTESVGYRVFTEPPTDSTKQYKYRAVISKVGIA